MVEVLVWRGDWGIPSVDFLCLQLTTLVKISGARAKIIETDVPPFGDRLPAFGHGQTKLYDFEHVLTYLNDKNYCADSNLTREQLAESFALRTMIQEKLRPASIYIWWVDEKNYNRVTRPWYAKAMPFPLSYYYPARYRRENERIIRSLSRRNFDDDFYHQDRDHYRVEIQVRIFREAEKCLNCLSERLATTDYFYGDCPSSLDAFAYGYLAPLLAAPFPSNVLQNHIKACPNLVKFVTRITRRYFSRELLEYENRTRAEKKKPSSSASPTLPNKTRNQTLAAAFAAIAMVGFGIFTGIFSITVNGTSTESNSSSNIMAHFENNNRSN